MSVINSRARNPADVSQPVRCCPWRGERVCPRGSGKPPLGVLLQAPTRPGLLGGWWPLPAPFPGTGTPGCGFHAERPSQQGLPATRLSEWATGRDSADGDTLS